MADRTMKLSLPERAVIMASLHIAKHFWMPSTDPRNDDLRDEVDEIIDSLSDRFKASFDDPAENKEMVPGVLETFAERAFDCKALDHIFLSGHLSVLLSRDPETALEALFGDMPISEEKPKRLH